MSDTRQVIGLPVEGATYFNAHREKKFQRGADSFRVLLDHLWADETIEAVTWDQYTPYFNDGDVCEFNVYEARLILANSNPVEGADRWESVELDEVQRPTVGVYDYADPTRRSYTPDQGIDNPEQLAALKAFSIDDGSFEDFLLDSFGDHVSVIALRDRFIVEEREHD